MSHFAHFRRHRVRVKIIENIKVILNLQFFNFKLNACECVLINFFPKLFIVCVSTELITLKDFDISRKK